MDRRATRRGADLILAGGMLLVRVDQGQFPEGIGIEIGPLLEWTYSLVAKEGLAWALLESGLAFGEARALATALGIVPVLRRLDAAASSGS